MTPKKREILDKQEILDEKITAITSDPNITREEKKRRILEALSDAPTKEDDGMNISGEINVDPYGKIDINIYNEEEEEVTETGKDGGISIYVCIIIETFVWRDGKLVEGKAKKRKTTTYSNWNSKNLNPDDIKRHRALLDRQHFRGPLWEGIGRPKSISEEPDILIKTAQNNESSKNEPIEENPLKGGEQSFEEVDR